MKYSSYILVVCVAVIISAPMAYAADQSADKSAIEKVIKSYTAAFNAHDAKLLAAHWSPEAVYTNPLTGRQVEGRASIEKEFAGILAKLKKTKLVVDVQSIRFISPSVAVENGVAKVNLSTTTDNTVEVWFNIALTETEGTLPAADSTDTVTAANMTLDNYFGFYTGNVHVSITDELRLGDSLADVIPTTGPDTIPGDINGDGTVDEADLAEFTKFYGIDFFGDLTTGDFNLDGQTDLADLLILKQHFGESNNAPVATAVPEPSTLILFAIAAFGLVFCVRMRKS